MSKIIGITRYRVLEAWPGAVSPHGRQSLKVAVKPIDGSAIDLIEHSREGYSPMALRYLNSNHCGTMLMVGNTVAAMGWTYSNRTDLSVRVKGYFSVPPHTAYLHGDWTREEFRGQGLQSLLIVKRAEAAFRHSHINRLVTNIEPSNEASMRNYRRVGFERGRSIVVGRVGRFHMVRSVRGGDEA